MAAAAIEAAPSGGDRSEEIRRELEERLEENASLREARPSILDLAEAGGALEALQLPGETDADFCAGRRTITARVIALEQPIFLNRSGANIPQGAIYALASDVVDTSSGDSCYPDDPSTIAGINSVCQPGQVQLRPGKRPRPMVLRADEGDCVKINFTNLLAKTAPTNPPQPTTRTVSLHIQGMNWVNGPQDDGSWVGRNCNSQVQPDPTKQSPNACPVTSGNSTTYTLFADHEGSYLIYSRGDDYTAIPQGSVRETQFGQVPSVSAGGGDGGFLQFGLFGSMNVQPSGYEEAGEFFESKGLEAAKLWSSEWYRSQVTEQDLCWASKGHTAAGDVCSFADPTGLPVIDYQAIYSSGALTGFPILNMLCAGGGTVCQANEIVHTDLTAIITGPDAGRFPDTFRTDEQPPALRPVYSYPQRLQPYREFTIAYHESYQVAQAFQYYFTNLPALQAAQDNYGINYGMGGLAPVVLANRLSVGPATDCVECKYEEFFLTSWSLGDPAMVVDNPAETCLKGDGTPIPGCRATKAFFPDDPSNVYHSYMSDHLKFRILHAGPDLHHLHHQHAHQWLGSPNSPNADYLDSQSIGPGSSFTLEMVYEGSGNLNQTVGDSIFHCHFYPHFGSGMWSLWRVHDVFEAGTRLDENGRPVSYCEGYGGKQPYTVEGDELVCPSGTRLITEARALPDGEIMAGTPTPGLVPMPTLPMAPPPAPVRLVDGGINHEVLIGDRWVSAQEPTPFSWDDPQVASYQNPGYPFFIPGIGGRRAPHPPLDLAWVYSGCTDPTYNGSICTHTEDVPSDHKLMKLRAPAPDPTCRCDTPLDGGLPRHVMNGPKSENESEYLLEQDPGLTDAQLKPYAQTDFSKEIEVSPALELAEEGTYVEKVAMAAHAQRFHYQSQLPDGTQCGTCSDNQAPCWGNTPEGLTQCGNPFAAATTCVDLGSASCGEGEGHINFVLNGLDPVPGAPFADPCIQFNRNGGSAPGGIERQYLAVDLQLDAIFNKEGWHFPQQRMISLWGDAQAFLTKQKPPEPLFMRVNSYDCMNYTLANLVPNVYELDDFQVRTPTDVLGQHIHLVKFDVTSSDGSANGWNYEDGTFAPNEVTERIRGINAAGGLKPFGSTTGQTLTPAAIAFFGQGPGEKPGVVPGTGAWLGAQATIQRWYDDPLFNNLGFCSTDLGERCTLAENTPGAPSHCPNEGLCIPSAGFCSNDPSQRCTEFDLSNCAANAECNPLFDRTIRTVFTHDHFGPSTHQQAGLYAGVVAEPKDSEWRMNQLLNQADCAARGGIRSPKLPADPGALRVCIMGGWSAKTSSIFPSRKVTQNNVTIQDSGPTSWEAVIVPPTEDASYREFMFQVQDSTLMYQPFYTSEFVADVDSNVGKSQYYNGDPGVCDTVTDEPCGYCSYTGRCSVDASIKCLMPSPTGTAVKAPALGSCPDVTNPTTGDPQAQPCVLGTGFLTACTTTHKDDCISFEASFQPHGVDSCNYVTGVPATTWASGNSISGGTPEGITFSLATNNFSYNYRNEPLFPRIDDPFTQTPYTDSRGDLGNVYSSLRRGNPRGSLCALNLSQACDPTATNPCGAGDANLGPCEDAGFCSTTQLIGPDNLPNYALCTASNLTYCIGKYPSCDAVVTPNQDPIPYRPLTPGVFPGDPFTPLLRAYAGDDVQFRMLTGAHINPHNITIHGVNWLKEPSFVDSGWRNSEVSGISEHFEMITKLDAPYSSKPVAFTDYLFQPGLAAIEQASGNWGLTRAYNSQQDDLPQLPQNEESSYDSIPICPEDATVRSYDVVALMAPQVKDNPGGALVYSTAPGPQIQDAHAMLFFRTDDPSLHCSPNDTSPWTCDKPYGGKIEPLVLRAAAGECIQVTLSNGIDPQYVAQTGVTSTPVTGGTSNVSQEVGLHPQLVTYDLRTSDGTNVGFNPEQTVAPGGTAITYTWYAGHVEPSPPEGKPRYIPIEFGGSNLLPPDPLNHYRHGLFGGLVIEPAGSTWTAPDGNAFAGVEAVVSYVDPEGYPSTFREFVLFTQDDLQNVLFVPANVAAPGGNEPVNAVNYKSAYLGNPTERYCDNLCQKSATIDVSCTVSDAAFCLDNANPPNCTPCISTAPAPTFAACAGEEVRFRLLHPGGTNTNEVFELFGHSFSEAPYVTAQEHCQPPTTHTNLYASQFLGQVNLCGSAEFFLSPSQFIQERILDLDANLSEDARAEGLMALDEQIALNPGLEELLEAVEADYLDLTTGGVWDASLNEWKASRMGHGPGNHFDVLVDSAGGANAVAGDYLWRSFPAMHFYPGMWGIFRVLDPSTSKGLTCHLPTPRLTVSVATPAATSDGVASSEAAVSDSLKKK